MDKKNIYDLIKKWRESAQQSNKHIEYKATILENCAAELERIVDDDAQARAIWNLNKVSRLAAK